MAGLLNSSDISNEEQIVFSEVDIENEGLNVVFANMLTENEAENDDTNEFFDSVFPIINNQLPAEDFADTEVTVFTETYNVPSILSFDITENNFSSQSAEMTEGGIFETIALAGEEGSKIQTAAEKLSNELLSKTERALASEKNAAGNVNNLAFENTDSKNNESDLNFSQNRQEEASPGRLDELRNRNRHERLAFEIRDQRTNTEYSQTKSFASVEAAMSRNEMQNSLTQEITLELRLPDFNNAGQSAQTTWNAKASQTGFGNALENMLARELHQNFNGDIVRHASMALRDGGESTIKLNLRPDTLGNVKILLEMTENKVTGIILVESEEALNAFRKEIAALEQAFMESGFADANLDLSLASEGNNAPQEQLPSNVQALQMAASGYEDSLRDGDLETGILIDFYNRGLGSVNMYA